MRRGRFRVTNGEKSWKLTFHTHYLLYAAPDVKAYKWTRIGNHAGSIEWHEPKLRHVTRNATNTIRTETWPKWPNYITYWNQHRPPDKVRNVVTWLSPGGFLVIGPPYNEVPYNWPTLLQSFTADVSQCGILKKKQLKFRLSKNLKVKNLCKGWCQLHAGQFSAIAVCLSPTTSVRSSLHHHVVYPHQ